MTKKFIITLTIILCAIFATTYSFATNEIKNGAMDAADGVRNVVGDVENGIENVAKDTAGAVRQGTNDVENAGEDITNDVMNQGTNGGTTTNNDNMNDGYSAIRTATDMTGGMSSTMWTWLILAIVAIAIIALVWYYAAQKNNSHDNY